MFSRWLRLPLALSVVLLPGVIASCNTDAPVDFGKTPAGPGATVRFDLTHDPLPDIPLPSDTATWPDPTSRTGLRINASLVAPTAIERDARERFDRLEGWGTFSPITVSFDLDEVGGEPRRADQAAIDLANVEARHHGDDYDFADDAVYLVNLSTGIPVPLDVGNGNFEFTLKRLDRYWANDTRSTERNLVFESRDESAGGAVTRATFTPDLDTDFDGVMDVPNLDEPFACGNPDAICDDPGSADFETDACVEMRRVRDRCITDRLLTYYERETDTLVLRPLIPLDEMTKYAVVITDRLIDANGDAVKSPFSAVFHASQRPAAELVMNALDDGSHAAYFGDVAGTGLDRVAFTWTFTTQPTVEDMKVLRDGLYGSGPFAQFEKEFPPQLELHRLIGKVAGLEQGAIDPEGWASDASCENQAQNLYVVRPAEIRDALELAVTELFGSGDGPDTQALLRSFEAIDYIAIGSYKTPFLLQGGPQNADPKAAFDLDYTTGAGETHEDVVQFFLIVPKETEQFQQPFNVNIYGHGYTGNFLELIFYAGNLAEHGLATIGINAMGHGLDLGDETTETLAKGLFSGACAGPLSDALVASRGRDLDGDGRADSGGDFWSSYLFHTRDGVRQSVLDHIQLVRILRAFGTTDGRAFCKNEDSGWASKATAQCDTNGDGKADVFGDFDGDGVADIGGESATYGTWGESLGGILSGVHGAIDAYVTSASPGSGGGGLTDIGVRSFQGGVIEAVLLRMWGPLLVTVPSEERPQCAEGFGDANECTVCKPGEVSLRWVVPDVNDTGEIEANCLDPADIRDTTVLIYNQENDELRCASIGDDLRMRVGVPASINDQILVSFYDGAHQVEDYDSCRPTFDGESSEPKLIVDQWGKGPFTKDAPNETSTSSCLSDSCAYFQGQFFGEKSPLSAPAEGYGQIRQTPSLRRFLQLAQMALEPGDPVSFAPYYAIKPMTDPFGNPIASHAVLTINTIGDMNVPLNSGIAFARASGALPFFRPDQLAAYPEYADYVTPAALYDALGATPNQDLIDKHVIEGITALARHPAGSACETSANAAIDGTFLTIDGDEEACFPTGCVGNESVCNSGSFCDAALDRCMPNQLGKRRCEEALYDADDLDEGDHLYFEQAAPVPHRLVRYTESAVGSSVETVWEPRLAGVPGSSDGGWKPASGRRVTGLLDAYVVPEGVHTFVNGNPCQSFDHGTYLTNLVGRFFQSDGTDVYYLSHPTSHHCLETSGEACGYITP